MMCVMSLVEIAIKNHKTITVFFTFLFIFVHTSLSAVLVSFTSHLVGKCGLPVVSYKFTWLGYALKLQCLVSWLKFRNHQNF